MPSRRPSPPKRARLSIGSLIGIVVATLAAADLALLAIVGRGGVRTRGGGQDGRRPR